MRFLTLITTLIFISTPSFAYIPSADFILSKVIKNSGSGYYQVKQEVNFPTAERNITVTETWWIQNDDVMFMKAEGPSFTLYFLYKKGKKYFFNPNGGVYVSSIPSDFYENLFFKRSTQDLKESLIHRKIVPAQIFKKRPVIKTAKDLQDVVTINEPYLTLTRLEGTVSYLLGYAAKEEDSPGLWVEQDHFAIKKLQLPSKVSITNDGFADLSKNLVYPKSQKVSWGDQSVQIEFSRADGLSRGISFFDEKEFSKLEKQSKPLPPEWAQSIVGDFYKRFR